LIRNAIAASLAPAASKGTEADMRAICEALGFDPTNHHNAAKCPYCRPSELEAQKRVDISKCRNGNCGQWVDNCDFPDCCK